MKNETEVNYGITADNVLLIDSDGNSLGVVSKKSAMARAIEEDLDLVRVGNKTSDIPVCKIMNYGKFKFDSEKKSRLAKKNTVRYKCSEIQINYTTAEHDLQVKTNTIKKLIVKEGHDVILVLRLRGREVSMMDAAKEKLMHLVQLCSDFSSVKNGLSVADRDISIKLTKKPSETK